VLHRVQPSASSSKVLYLLISLRSSSSCLHLLPQHHVSYVLSRTFPSVTCFRGPFLRHIQLAYLHSVVCRTLIFYCMKYSCFISHTIDPIDLLQPSPASHLKTFKVLLIYISKCPCSSTIQSYTPKLTLYWFPPLINPLTPNDL
jgi:hypothetical protein